MKKYLMLIIGAAFIFALILNVNVAVNKPVKITHQLELAKAMDPDWCYSGGDYFYCYSVYSPPYYDENDFYVYDCGTCSEIQVSWAGNESYCIDPACLAW
jgi:hypothetical protein